MKSTCCVSFDPRNGDPQYDDICRQFTNRADAEHFALDQLENWLMARQKMALQDRQMMRPSEELERYRDELKKMVFEHHCANPRVYGPAQRGDDTPDDKLLLLADVLPGITLMDLSRLHLAQL